jgi:hypothetical protein
MSPVVELVRRYRALFLRHDPERSARMLTPKKAAATARKYDDIDGRITDTQLAEQLTGTQSYAVPWEVNGLAHFLALDIDSGGLPAITALVQECQQHGLWAFGQYTPKRGLPEEEQHGYVYVPFADLTNVVRLQQLGDALIAAIAHHGWKIENRAHGADTRLPMTYHQINGGWGILVLPDGERPIDPDPLGALAHLFATYHENALTLLPQAPEPRQTEQRASRPGSIDIARFNQEHDLEELLVSYGARRVGRGLYLCPFHDDQRASLGVYVRAGQLVCHCLSTHSECPLAKRGRNDAFNVYCIGEGLSEEEALRRLNQGAGEPPASGSQTPPAAPGSPPPTKPTNETPSLHQPRQSAPHRINGATDTTFPLWFRDQDLTTFLSKQGSSGVLMLHKAREKLGESATNRQINAEIARRRGRPYTDRHLRALNRERRTLITAWQAQASLAEAENRAVDPGDFHPATTHDKELPIASRGGEPQPAEAQAPRQRRRVAKDTKQRALDRKRQRVARWRNMDIQQLEREYCILQRTARKAKTATQQRALEYQVKELAFELARARGKGLQAMQTPAEEESSIPEQPTTPKEPLPPLRAPSLPFQSRWESVAGVFGELVPQRTGQTKELPDDDPWVQLQRVLLERAEREGERDRVAFYQAVLHIT